MKRIRLVLSLMIVSCFCMLSLVGCGSTTQTTTAVNEVKPTATATPSSTKYQPPSDELVNGKVPYDYEYDYSNLEFDEVDSSCFSEVSYDINNEILVVRFRDSGALYYYYKISPSFYDSFRSAESLGGFYNDSIKGKFSCYRLE